LQGGGRLHLGTLFVLDAWAINLYVNSAIWHYLYCQMAELKRDPLDNAEDAKVPNLADPADRRRLTPAAVRGFRTLSELWQLDAAEAAALLGDMSERSWYRFKKQQSDMLSQD